MANNVKMCPLLTAGILASSPPPTKDGVIDVSQGFEAMPCQRELCAFWLQIADEQGRIVQGQGNCGIPLTATVASQAAAMIHNGMSTKKIIKG